MKRKAVIAVQLLLAISLSPALAEAPDWCWNARMCSTDTFWSNSDPEASRPHIQALVDQGITAVLFGFHPSAVWEMDWPAVSNMVSYIHANFPTLKVVGYIVTLEVVTDDVDMDEDGVVDPGKTSWYTEHPDTLQVRMDGTPVLYYGAVYFWVGPTSEDVWLSPADPFVIQMSRDLVQKVTEAGVDAIWHDVPVLAGGYATYDDDARAKYIADTGQDLPAAVDWGDPNWRRHVMWRQELIRDYVSMLRDHARSFNPDVQYSIEHYNGWDSGGTRGAWSPDFVKPAVDFLTHEVGTSSYEPRDYAYYNWLRDLAIFRWFRDLDGEAPSWFMGYTSESNAIRWLAATVLTAGGCFYEASLAPGMVGSVDLAERQRVCGWIGRHEELYDARGRRPLANIGLLYSRATVDYRDEPQGFDEHTQEHFGLGMMLLESHVPYITLLTPGLSFPSSFEGIDLLLIPDAPCMSDATAQAIGDFVNAGGKILISGEGGTKDEWGVARATGALEGLPSERVFTHGQLGIDYRILAKTWFGWQDPCTGDPEFDDGEPARAQFLAALGATGVTPPLATTAPRKVSIIPYEEEEGFSLRVLNLTGVGLNSLGTVPRGPFEVRVRPRHGGTVTSASYLPYLTDTEQPLSVQEIGGEIVFSLSVSEHGAVTIRTSGSADLNRDGRVDGLDLGMLMSAWGGAGPLADIDGDGTVGEPDLTIMLAQWDA